MRNRLFFRLAIIAILFAMSGVLTSAQDISCEGCYDGEGNPVGCGDPWTVEYNGTSYNCVCVCGVGGGPQCTPVSSSSSSSNSSGYSSGYSSSDFRTDLATAVIGGLFNALNNWLNSPPPGQNNSQATSSPAYPELSPAEKAEIERKKAEYKQHVKEQVDKATDEYARISSQSFEDRQAATAIDFKTRLIRSESVRTIRQLNCAAYNSLKAARANCENIDFTTLNGEAEQARSSADIASGLPSDCPEIKIRIPDVAPSHPVGFQQVFYQTVKFKADSIASHVKLLKESGIDLQKKIESRKAEIVKLKSETGTENNGDQLLAEAMKALKESEDQQDDLTEEIRNSEKNIELYDMIRSTYDIDKTDKSTQKNEAR